MSPTEIKMALIEAHRRGDWEAAKRLTHEKQQARKRECVDCGVPVRRGTVRCRMLHTAHRYYALALACAVMLCTLSAFAATVTLAWDASTGTNVAGYHLYHGALSGVYLDSVVDAGTNLTASVTNLPYDVPQFFAATAYDPTGLESEFSSEVEYTATNPPPDVITLTLCDFTATSVTLDWTSSNPAGIAGYSFYVSRPDALFSFGLGTNLHLCLDWLIKPDTDYGFYVKSYDAAGTMSDPSNTVECHTLPPPPPPPPTNIVFALTVLSAPTLAGPWCLWTNLPPVTNPAATAAYFRLAITSARF